MDTRGVNVSDFENHLLFTANYLEDWRDALDRLRRMIMGPRKSTYDAAMHRARIRVNTMRNIIKSCKEAGYFDPSITDRLKITPNGYAFSNFGYVGFANEVLKKYGPIISFIFGLPIGGVLLYVYSLLR